MAYYQFAPAPAPGVTVLSVGPDTVYFVREVQPQPTVPCSDRGQIEKPRDDDRVKYANALAGAQWLRQETHVTVVWKNSDDFRQEISRRQRAVADQYRNLVSVLARAKHLTEDESQSLTPIIAVTVEDGRQDKSEPLPRP